MQAWTNGTTPYHTTFYDINITSHDMTLHRSI